jgi:hypothetical protein
MTLVWQASRDRRPSGSRARSPRRWQWLSILVACGGGKKTYTYNLAAKAGDQRAAGTYLTVISPVKLPASAFKSGRLVAHVTGPEDCAFTQRINKPPPKYAALNGTKLTVKV